jgi:hypothetical protein
MSKSNRITLMELRVLLPDFEIIKEGELFGFKRQTAAGKTIIIPLLKDRPTKMAKIIERTWKEKYA